MALTYREKEMCVIKTPSWLEADQIEALLQEEKNNENGFTKLPFHYFEIGIILLKQAKDDIENRSKVGSELLIRSKAEIARDWWWWWWWCWIFQIRRALEDLRSERFYKVRAGLKSLEGRTSAVKLNNLSALEINMIRSFFIKTLNAYQRYDISEVDWRNEQSYALDSAQTPQGTPARGHPVRYSQ